MPSRGALIVIEGIDKSGKSTQCQKLVEVLNDAGHKVERRNFPDRKTEMGELIDSDLKKKIKIDDYGVHLLFSANRWEKSREMLTQLNSGVTLIVDRYAYSGIAYTLAKKNFTRDLEWCKQPDRGLPEPDLVFLLDVPVSVAEERGFDKEKYEDKDFLEKVRSNFLEFKWKQWTVINGNQSFKSVHEDLLSGCEKTISTVEHKPIGELWVDE